MREFAIITDSSCDIPDETMAAWGVHVIQLEVHVDGEPSRKNNEVDIYEFYQKLKDGKMARTTGTNMGVFREHFEQELKDGRDIVYIGLSSGLSSTYSYGEITARELLQEYPERKIFTIDSLGASSGQGLMVYLACQKRDAGVSVEDTAAYIDTVRYNVCHWFTVDDLFFLKRGGRVSGATALVGSMLGIKPILHADDEGHLVATGKVRGRKAAIKALADKYGELALTLGEGTVFISHGDCLDDAKELKSMLKETYGVDTDRIEMIGPVIGAHSGPATLALFFLGTNR